MIRSEICAVAELAVPTFNSHRRNGNLPFSVASYHEMPDHDGRTWARFTVFDAALLIAAKKLTAQGVSWSKACEILRSKPVGTGGRVGLANPGISAARTELRSGDSQVWQGPIARIVEVSERWAARKGSDVISIVSVNVSACISIAIERMDRLDIEVNEESLRLDPDAEK